jgi:hypothetical protein
LSARIAARIARTNPDRLQPARNAARQFFKLAVRHGLDLAIAAEELDGGAAGHAGGDVADAGGKVGHSGWIIRQVRPGPPGPAGPPFGKLRAP